MSNNLVIVEKNPSFMQRTKAFFSTKAAQLMTVVTVVTLNGVTAAHAEGGISVESFQPIITLISGMVAIVSSIGMAVLTVYATSKVFKWVKTAF